MNSFQACAENKFRAAWSHLEETRRQPQFIRNVHILPYDEFAIGVSEGQESFVEEITSSLYAGDAYILRDTYDKNAFRDLVHRLYEFSQNEPSSFHKLLNGAPDYHRIIDSENTLKYSVTAVRRGYYFFRWNDDPVEALDLINDSWRTFKVLSGLRPTEFENNVPSDGVIDRLMFYHYPKGGGQLKNHVDPTNNHKIIIGAMMSERDVDFQTGGFFSVLPDRNRISLENDLKLGDALIMYPTVEHGVEPIDEGQDRIWDSIEGRWFMGLASVDSDHMAERTTAARRV